MSKEIGNLEASVAKLDKMISSMNQININAFESGMLSMMQVVTQCSINATQSLQSVANSLQTVKTADEGGSAGFIGNILSSIQGVEDSVGIITGIGPMFDDVSESAGRLFGKEGIFSNMGSEASKLFGGSGLFGKSGLIYSALDGIQMAMAGFGNGGAAASFGLIGLAIIAIGTGLVDLWNTSESFRDNVGNMWDIICTAFTDAKQKIWDNGLLPLWDSLKEFFSSLYRLYEESGLKSIFEKVVTAIGYIASFLVSGLISVIGTVIQWIANGVQLIIEIITGIIDGVLWVKDCLGQGWQGIIAIFTGVIDWIANVFATNWSEKFGFFGQVLNGFLAIIQPIISGIIAIFSGLINFVVGVFSGNWSQAWEGIKEIFGGIWSTFKGIVSAPINSILSLVENMINGVITAFNGVKRVLNGFHLKIPNWVPEIGGKTFGFNFEMTDKVHIPRLAKGGILNSGQAFIAREAGPELVGRFGSRTAVMNNDQLVDSVTNSLKQAFAEVMLCGGAAKDTQPPIVEVTIKTDSETLYRTVQKGERKYNRRFSVMVPV